MIGRRLFSGRLLTMPPELVKAYQSLDRAVDLAHGRTAWKGEAERVAFLSGLYGEMTSLFPAKKGCSETCSQSRGLKIQLSSQTRHLVVDPAVQLAAGKFLANAAPLLEEERDA